LFLILLQYVQSAVLVCYNNINTRTVQSSIIWLYYNLKLVKLFTWTLQTRLAIWQLDSAYWTPASITALLFHNIHSNITKKILIKCLNCASYKSDYIQSHVQYVTGCDCGKCKPKIQCKKRSNLKQSLQTKINNNDHRSRENH